MKQLTLRLEEKVAQLFLVGSDTASLAEETEPFTRYGLGGILLFRHHLQPFDSAMELREGLHQMRQGFRGAGLSFVAIDQEGGQVERLPHWVFPTGILPVVLGMKQDLHFSEQVYREMARRMRWLGITLNFAPTVDLNKELFNPIIGVRAYGDTPETVIPQAKMVVKSHQEAGVLPVLKHFPGHGSGTVDSHHALPVFEAWDESELVPYQDLLSMTPCGVLVAHGLYPQLAKTLHADSNIPASLSEAITTQLLHQQMGFSGLVFTDDLMMGAVWGDSDPAEVALKALEAGADMLVYRRAQPEALQAFEFLVHRFQQGKLSEAWLDAKVQRILQTRDQLNRVSMYDYPEISVSEEACQGLALQWAQEALIELKHQFVSPLPLSHTTRWALVAPERDTMVHYRPDGPKDKGLLAWCQYYGLQPQGSQFYPVQEGPYDGETWPEASLEVIVFVAFNSLRFPAQQTHYQQLKAQHPEAKFIVVSCGMPTDREVLSTPWVHVQLPSYRPAAMQALVQWLITSPRDNNPTVQLGLGDLGELS